MELPRIAVRLILVALVTTLLASPYSRATGRHEQAPISGGSRPAARNNSRVESTPFTFSGIAPSQWIEVPNVSVKIITSGKPVFVGIIPENQSSGKLPEPFTVGLSAPQGQFSLWQVMLVRDSNFELATVTATYLLNPGLKSRSALSMEIPFSINTIDIPEQGSHTYTIRLHGDVGKLDIKGARLVAYQL
jgi:hypothetical protein